MTWRCLHCWHMQYHDGPHCAHCGRDEQVPTIPKESHRGIEALDDWALGGEEES